MNTVNATEKYFEYEHDCRISADNNIAHGSLTNSKRASSFVEGVYPTHLESGVQEYAIDVSGRKYVDYICGLGSNLFGYTNPDVKDSLITAINKGLTLSLGSTSEVKFAEMFKAKFPHCQKIRILKSGSEGCSAAIRIARTWTGRDLVLSDGYHGWHDEFTSLTPPAKGVPRHDSIEILTMENLERLNPAAVIIEPVILEWSQGRRDYIERLRIACTRLGVVLIFVETITAYRFPECSVARYWGIEPDISIQGKALANGMPLSVVGGRADIMDSDYFVSSTFAGERLSLEAGITCVNLISGRYSPKYVWEQGREFMDRMNRVLNPLIYLEGYPARGAFKGSTQIRSLFFQEMVKCGYLFHPSTWFYNIHLHNHMHDVVDLASKIRTKILGGDISLEGRPFQLAFKKEEYKL